MSQPWARALVAVPTDRLRVDPSVSAASPKGFTERQLQEIAATIPFVYEAMANGRTEREFMEMCLSADVRERQLGETYQQLFRNGPSSSPLRASWDGRGLQVDAGNHRVRSAQQIGVPVLPVVVSAPTQGELEAARAHLEAESERLVGRETLIAHRDAAARWVPAPTRLADRERMLDEGRERDLPRAERER